MSILDEKELGLIFCTLGVNVDACMAARDEYTLRAGKDPTDLIIPNPNIKLFGMRVSFAAISRPICGSAGCGGFHSSYEDYSQCEYCKK